MATRIARPSANGARQWRIPTTGHFALVHAATGEDVSPATRKARAILAFLCLHPGQRFTRERIATLLWGDRGEAQARASLRQALLEIRQATANGPQLLQSDREHIWVEPTSLEPEALDETSWAHSDELLFDDLDNISADLDDWLALARNDRNRNLADALRAEIQRLLDRERGAAALPLVDRLDRLDPFDESTLRLALRAEFQAGRVAAIEQRVRDMESRLQAELGVGVSSGSKALRDELIEALGTSKVAPRKLRQPEPPEEPVGMRHRVDGKPRWRWPVLAAALLTIVVLGFVGVRALRLAQPAAPKMLAVLPFAASDGADADFADGLSDELITQLAQSRDLRVIGRTSAWQYKGKAVDLRTIGRQLGVEYLVEGDVSQAGDQMRVSVSLIRARDGTAMWSRIYRANSRQSPFLRGTIGGGVVAALGLPDAAIAAAYKPDGEAYALYLKARALFRQRTKPSLENARTLLLEAIRIDPKFAPPWAYAGGITNLLGEDRFFLDPTHLDGPSMTPRQALEHALVLDPKLADAHGMMGWVAGGNSVEGFRHLQRAVQLEPNDPQILFWYSLALLREGDYGKYAQVAHKAAALDPLWQKSVLEGASASLWVGDKAAVRHYLERIRTGNPQGALEVEAQLAGQEGDISRLIEIAVRDKKRPYQDSTVNAAMALMDLGFEREGRLVGQFGPKDVVYGSNNLPPRSALLRLARAPGSFDYDAAMVHLRTRGRYSDIAALFDDATGDLAAIRHPLFVNRQFRMIYGGQIAQALYKVGRKAEAAQLLQVTDDADRAILASGNVYPCDLALIAGNEAVAGRKEDAIRLLQRTANFHCLTLTPAGQPDPIFESLRGDPRFEELVRRQVEHLQNERRKVIAMNLF